MSKSATTVKPKIAYGALLGRVVEHHRTKRKVHQEQLARALGITQSAYSKLAKGQSSISVVQLNAVAACLKTPSATLLGDTERYALCLRQQGVEITNEKQAPTSAAQLVALGLLAALIAAGDS